MLIENPEALKTWLTSVLEPLCDADPTALAKYVIALVKKEKPLAELKSSCLEQLDVFLQEETCLFVENLFVALSNKSYINDENSTTLPKVEPEVSIAPATNIVSNLASLPPAQILLGVVDPTSQTTCAGTKVETHRTLKPDGVITSDGSGSENRRQRSRSRSPWTRSRSRSKSWGKNRSRSRSRGRDDRRSGRAVEDERRRRNLGTSRRYERRRERETDRPGDRIRDRVRDKDRPRDGSRTRSRSPGLYRSRSPKSRSPTDRSQYRSGQQSDSANSDKKETNVVSTVVQPTTPIDASAPPPGIAPIKSSKPPPENFVNRQRCRDYDEKGYCMRGDLCPYDHGIDPVVVEDMNIFPFSQNHPTPPGTTVAPSLPSAMMRPPPPGVLPPPPEPYIPEPYNPDTVNMDHSVRSGPRPPGPQGAFWNSGPGIRPPMPRGPVPARLPAPYHHVTRELINVPTIDDSGLGGKKSFGNNNGTNSPMDGVQNMPPNAVYEPSAENVNNQMMMDRNSLQKPNMQQQQQQHQQQQRFHPNSGGNPNKRKAFDPMRNAPPRRQFKQDNCILELRKIPKTLNTITQINNHFSKFGKIVNLQVCYEGDSEAAVVEFSNHGEALCAYRSTEPILNNRFIKVFWHNKTNNEQEGGGQSNSPADPMEPMQKKSVKDRLGPAAQQMQTQAPAAAQPTLEDKEKSSAVVTPTGSISRTVFNPAALRKNNVPPPINKVMQARAAHDNLKKKQETQRREALQIKADLQKKTRELLAKQLAEQKSLIDRLENNKNLSPSEKEGTMKTIKALQVSIERLKKELDEVANNTRTSPTGKKNKQQAQKDLLDTEIELYNTQHQGGDTKELFMKLSTLRAEAKALGIISMSGGRGRGGVLTRGAPGGRGGSAIGRGRGRGGFQPPLGTKVDRRPRKLSVSGYQLKDKELVLAHFAQFGSVENVETEQEGVILLVTYKTRREAEIAMVNGRTFKEQALVLSWFKELRNSASSEVEVDIEHEDGEDAILGGARELVSNEVLLAFDDEEEEDSEARSWRR